MRSTFLATSILIGLSLFHSTVTHAGRTTRTVEAPELVAGTWTSAETDRSGRARVSIDLARTSIVVPTVSTETSSTVVFTSKRGIRTRATAGESIELEAGSYTMDVSVESRATVGAYTTAIHDMTLQRLVGHSGKLAGYAVHMNPALVDGAVIRDSVGERLVSATLIFTARHINLVVEGEDDTLIIEYAAESDEGRTALGRYGLSDLESAVLDLPALDRALSSGRFDPTRLPLNDILVDDVITSGGLDLSEEVAVDLPGLMDAMDDIAAMAEETGTHGGFVGGAIGGGVGGAIGTALGGPVAGWAMGTAIGWAASEFEDAVAASLRDDDGDGKPNGVDPDMDGDGIPNHRDDDTDGDGTPNDEDDYPRNKKKSIWAQSEGPMVPTWLTDTPLGDESIAFDFQVDFILDDLDALEDFGAIVGGTY